jgi:energy-coupling factor transporter transmembrane protein EcfT
VTYRLSPKESPLIVLGVVLLIIGFLTGISVLWTIGLVLVVVGAILAILGGTGRKVGGRAHWY